MTAVTVRGPVARRRTPGAHATASRLPGRLRLIAACARLVVAWGVLGLIAGLLLAVTGGEFVRVQAMTVLSGSMRPTLGVGDLVVTQVTRADELQAGDVVTFRDPSVQRYVTHRVQSVVWRGQTADVITRGDANEVGETWSVRAEGTLGVVVLRVPWLGYVVGALSTRTGHLAMTAAAVLLGGWSLLLIWRPRRSEPAGDTPTPPGSRPQSSPRRPRSWWCPVPADRRTRRLRLAGAALATLVALAMAPTGGTQAAFIAPSVNAGNTLASAPDWRPPIVTALTVIKAEGGTPGYVRRNASYRLIAKIADDPSSQPPSGVGTVTGNAVSLTAGATTVALPATTTVVAGVTYTHQSAALTSSNTLANGTYGVSVSSGDLATPVNVAGTFLANVVVDRTAPAASALTIVNGGWSGGPTSPTRSPSSGPSRSRRTRSWPAGPARSAT